MSMILTRMRRCHGARLLRHIQQARYQDRQMPEY
jgi:hypothetical protein